jgi:O-acetyl-ADP-ribose deacetylase (regulator of RNase III)
MNRIQIKLGDITEFEGDAIVNAANVQLSGGEGVDGAIHRAAGPHLLEECQTLGGCEVGEAKITEGYNLKARHVIHTVGPMWEGGENDEEELLESCYNNSLWLAEEHQTQTMAFPAISTGAYDFPKDLAAQIAIGTTKRFLEANELPEQVTFFCFDEDSLDLYEAINEDENDNNGLDIFIGS